MASTRALLWALGLSLPVVVFGLGRDRPADGLWLLSLFNLLATGLGQLLPFAAFAGGAASGRARGSAFGAALASGLGLGFATYLLLAFAHPLLQHSYEVRAGWVSPTLGQQFGARTPAGILRNLRYVEANPPAEYTMRIERPEAHYPSRLRLALNLPAALGVLALVNVLVGSLAASATWTLAPRTGRRVRAAVGFAGGLAYFGAFLAASSPDRDWSTASGVVTAWIPLAIPVVEAFLLAMVARRLGTLPPPLAIREPSQVGRPLRGGSETAP